MVSNCSEFLFFSSACISHGIYLGSVQYILISRNVHWTPNICISFKDLVISCLENLGSHPFPAGVSPIHGASHTPCVHLTESACSIFRHLYRNQSSSWAHFQKGTKTHLPKQKKYLKIQMIKYSLLFILPLWSPLSTINPGFPSRQIVTL